MTFLLMVVSIWLGARRHMMMIGHMTRRLLSASMFHERAKVGGDRYCMSIRTLHHRSLLLLLTLTPSWKVPLPHHLLLLRNSASSSPVSPLVSWLHASDLRHRNKKSQTQLMIRRMLSADGRYSRLQNDQNTLPYDSIVVPRKSALSLGSKGVTRGVRRSFDAAELTLRLLFPHSLIIHRLIRPHDLLSPCWCASQFQCPDCASIINRSMVGFRGTRFRLRCRFNGDCA